VKGLTPGDFARLMSPFAPFEDAPHLAVAVSGGADSMALCLLADRWARARHGRITALTVDHGLRPDSAAEARQVARWLRARHIAHATLRWADAKPATGIEAAARDARHRLLAEWCARRGVLHLLLAHHREDQAETVALRMERASGADGLAGMAAVVERAETRLLRPLLPVPRSRLRATLAAAGQGWIDDPMNRDPAFARARLRLAGQASGRSAASLAAAARRAGIARAAREAEVATLLASCAAFMSPGRIDADAAPIIEADPEIGRRAIVRMLIAVGGGAYPPRGDRLAALYGALRAGRLGRGRTLGGCRVAVSCGRLVVAREGPRRASGGGWRRAAGPAQPLAPPRFGVV
jgi:tRNA(Ile)-lysidine synthase